MAGTTRSFLVFVDISGSQFGGAVALVDGSSRLTDEFSYGTEGPSVARGVGVKVLWVHLEHTDTHIHIHTHTHRRARAHSRTHTHTHTHTRTCAHIRIEEF